MLSRVRTKGRCSGVWCCCAEWAGAGQEDTRTFLRPSILYLECDYDKQHRRHEAPSSVIGSPRTATVPVFKSARGYRFAEAPNPSISQGKSQACGLLFRACASLYNQLAGVGVKSPTRGNTLSRWSSWENAPERGHPLLDRAIHFWLWTWHALSA